MAGVLTYVLVPIAVGAVAVVLLLGLWNMMRGGSPNTSQRLMRLRVLLQFIAIVIVMATIWVMYGEIVRSAASRSRHGCAQPHLYTHRRRRHHATRDR